MRGNYEHSKKLLEEIRNQFPKIAQEEGRLFFLPIMRSLKQRDFWRFEWEQGNPAGSLEPLRRVDEH
jgi:hypothetical protein